MKNQILMIFAATLFSNFAFAETMSASCTGTPEVPQENCYLTQESCLAYTNDLVVKYAEEYCKRVNGTDSIYHVEKTYERVSPHIDGGRQVGYWGSTAIRYSCRD